MVNIIKFDDDPHTQTQHLLPWYVIGKLRDKEREEVEQHLSQCASCREDLAMEKVLWRQTRSALSDVDRGWAALKAQIEAPRARAPKVALFSRRIPLGWVLAAQAASVAIVIALTAFGLAARPAPYRALSAAPGDATGNVAVMFKPDAPEAALRTILTQNQARIVDGPTAAGAYVLHVAADRRAAALARLAGDPHVSFAQPIDGDDR
jgi:anti-sigma factor RsiW